MKIEIRDNTLWSGIALEIQDPQEEYGREEGTAVHFDSIETLEQAIQDYKDRKAAEEREKHTKFKVGDIVRLTGTAWDMYDMRDQAYVVIGHSGAGDARIDNPGEYLIYWASPVGDFTATKIGEVTENE